MVVIIMLKIKVSVGMTVIRVVQMKKNWFGSLIRAACEMFTKILISFLLSNSLAVTSF